MLFYKTEIKWILNPKIPLIVPVTLNPENPPSPWVYVYGKDCRTNKVQETELKYSSLTYFLSVLRNKSIMFCK